MNLKCQFFVEVTAERVAVAEKEWILASEIIIRFKNKN